MSPESFRGTGNAISHLDPLKTLSHDIRNALHGVYSALDLLALTDLDVKQRKYIETMHICMNQTMSLLENVLSLSNSDSKPLEPHRADFNVHRLVYDVISAHRLLAQKKGFDLLVSVDKNVPNLVSGDEHKLRQILSNVLGNAVKFTDHGFVLLNVISTGYTLTFQILDSGIGIKESDLPRLMEAFQRGENQNRPGSGLGLHITRNLVGMLGGELSIKPRESSGTNVTITIPFSQPNDDSAEYGTALINPGT